MKSKYLFLVIALLTYSAGTLRAENVLRIAIPYSMWKIDPLAIEDPINRVILNNIALSSIRYNGDKREMMLAESIESSPDYTKWTIAPKAAAVIFSKPPPFYPLKTNPLPLMKRSIWSTFSATNRNGKRLPMSAPSRLKLHN